MQFVERFRQALLDAGVGEEAVVYAVDALEILWVLFLAWVANLIAKRVLLGIVHAFAERTKTDWDDRIVERKVFHCLSHLAPGMVIYSLAPLVFESPALIVWAQKGSQIYMILMGILTVNALLNAVNDIYGGFEVSQRIPILGYLQVIKLVASLAGLIVVVSLVIDRSPLLLLSGLGAATAIILLIFKDTILGLVAGIQLVANDMVRPGDWIEMPKYGADGDVEEITLNVVKVRNFDKTVTTIPTYSLIADSFKNWRGMAESGGRRIKRSLRIDVNSIRFLTPELTDRLKSIDRLRPFIEQREEEIAAANAKSGENLDASPANGRRMTNLGLFRAYCLAYLRDHPEIHDSEMTFLVRQLAPDPEGLPLELYVFTRDQRWIYYEAIQADIFDHLFAVLPLFELRPFQRPSGSDWRDAVAR